MADTATMHRHATTVLAEHLMHVRDVSNRVTKLQHLLSISQEKAFDPANESGTIIASALLIDRFGMNLLMWNDPAEDSWKPVGGPVDGADSTLLDCAMRHARCVGLRDIEAFPSSPIVIDSRTPREYECDEDARLTHNFVYLIVVQEDFVPALISDEFRVLKWVPIWGMDKLPRRWINMLNALAPKIGS